MSYTPHPSKELQRIFREKPYQGAHPAEAEFLFVNLDANFDSDIEHGPVWDAVKEYLADGVAFWRKYGIHHPFLLPEYRGAGLRFHQKFAEIGFTPDDAGRICFIELVNEATEGSSNLEVEDLNLRHLSRLNKIIVDGTARHIFVSPKVGELMRLSRKFPWIARKYRTLRNALGVWAVLGGGGCESRTVYRNFHFSVHWRSHLETLDKHIKAIRAIRRRN